MKVEEKKIAPHGSPRIVIVGGGISGLSTAARLAQAGFPVTVLEASCLGGGASTRNQGWLHSGAWFAPRQPQLARICYESLQHTLRFCPECVEGNPSPMIYMTSRGETDPDRWTAAWEAAGIPYQGVASKTLFDRFPGLAISQTQHAFQLPDRSIQTDLLLRRLADTAQQAGTEIRPGSQVERLLCTGGSVQGVELCSGETIPARLVILAGNAKGGALYPGFGAQAVGPKAETALVALKTHLLAIRPMLSAWPLCVVDADGLNHLPHQATSVFGTSRWLPVRHGEDQQVIPEEMQHLRDHLARLFPDSQRENQRVTEWAGTTVQAMHLSEIQAAQIPQPMIVDHQRESEQIANLISLFPGRATLWPHLAEETCTLVRAKLGAGEREIAQPPWGACGDEVGASHGPVPTPLRSELQPDA